MIQRIRTIKPEFFVHEDLATLSFAARLLFIGLWTVADRDGRLEDRPPRLKVQLFPYDDVPIAALLANLEQHGFIHRYVVESAGYIEIPAFLKHQRPNHREPASILPPCPSPPGHAQARPGTPGHARGELELELELERERELEGKGTDLSLAALARAPTPAFDEFWQLYPRHEGKQAARTAWQKLGPWPPLEAIRAALAWQRDLPRWQEDHGRFVPHPATYLHQRRWEDEPPVPTLVGITTRTAGNLAAIKAGLDLVPHDRR
jgi:hypothetical protein